jgi:hypothetical protein
MGQSHRRQCAGVPPCRRLIVRIATAPGLFYSCLEPVETESDAGPLRC